MTISGLVDLGINNINFKGNSVTTSGAANGSATSNLVFAGVEDLGGGTAAKFRWEIDPDLGNTVGKTAGTSATGTAANIGSYAGNGYSYLGLAGKFGEVQFGTLNFATLSANGDGNVFFATAVGSGYRVTSFDAVRAQNSASYETPSFAGFQAKYLMSKSNPYQWASTSLGNGVNQQYGRDGVGELSASYINGPLKLRAASLTVEQYAGYNNGSTTAYAAPTGAPKFKLSTLSANYVYGAATVGAFYQRATSDVLAKASTTTANSTMQYDRKTTGIALSYAITPVVTLAGNYQKVTVNNESGNSTTNGQTTTVKSLGADYALSKRTALYFRTEQDSDNAGVRAITGYTAVSGNTTYKATAVGVRHTF